MASLNVEITEPDSAAASLPNDQSVNKESNHTPALTAKTAVMEDDKSKNVNGGSEVEEQKSAEKNGTDTEVKATETDEKTEEKVEEQKSAEENGTVTEVKATEADEKTEEKGSLQKEPRVDQNGVLKTSVKIEKGANIKYSKYDPSILPPTDDPSKIRAQVEFYFGDANLPHDNHLWNMTDGENNLPVSIQEICNFGRMRRFKPISTVVAALKESEFLEVTGPEGHEQVNRKIAYNPLNLRSKSEARSIYVKGFGDEERSSQFDIEAFFAPYGPINAVRLRRTDEKLFKGSVFVEFADEKMAKNFLELDPKPLWKGKHPLQMESKKSYMDRKEQDIKDGKIEPATTRGSFRGRGWGRGRGANRGERNHNRNDRDGGRRGGDSKGDRDPDDWKKRREEDRASGFKDNHRRNDRGHHSGDRKGDNRSRGGRRDDRGPRNNDRNREREQKEREEKDHAEEKSEGAPVEKAVESPAESGKKRAREDDVADETPAKKIDTKSEVSIEAS